VDFVLRLAGDASTLTKRFTFAKEGYSFDVQILLNNIQRSIAGFEYYLLWENGLNTMERNSVDEASFAASFAYMAGELKELNASDPTKTLTENLTGKTDWVGLRSKYFAAALVSKDGLAGGALLEGNMISLEGHGVKEIYTVGLRMPLNLQAQQQNNFTVFVGPLDHTVLKEYKVGLEKMMSLGLEWLIRPIAEYVMLPLFQVIHLVVPNYGIVIIIFSLIIKVALYPLSKKQINSMKKMQALQPRMQEIREKYKGESDKMNREIMRLYKEEKINPASGCLPLLLQMPILYALWAVFQSAIELRQASFMLWITDLSIPDVAFTLPFSLPIFNIRDVSGLALLMGASMFLQQKQTVTDPRQKAMVYIFPVLLTLLFNSFPSGLNLYYFVFNVFQIIQQHFFTPKVLPVTVAVKKA
jgi:YidC/Oxa1 family membrane protein insertase